MNPQEAIEILDRYPRDFDAVPKSAKSEREFRIALSKAIEALEKQIPKKFEIWNGKDCCPTCKALFGNDETRKRLIHWEMDYCKYCGQAIDWGEGE